MLSDSNDWAGSTCSCSAVVCLTMASNLERGIPPISIFMYWPILLLSLTALPRHAVIHPFGEERTAVGATLRPWSFYLLRVSFVIVLLLLSRWCFPNAEINSTSNTKPHLLPTRGHYHYHRLQQISDVPAMHRRQWTLSVSSDIWECSLTSYLLK